MKLECYSYVTIRDFCTIVFLLPCGVENVLNQSFININSFIPCVFALPENNNPASAKVSRKIRIGLNPPKVLLKAITTDNPQNLSQQPFPVDAKVDN